MNEFENQVAAALSAIGWGAKEITVGSVSAWHLATETPAFKYDTLVRVFPASRRLAVLKARSSFDSDFAYYLFSRAGEKRLLDCPTDRISITADFKIPDRRFYGVGIAPPAVARCFASQSQFLADHSYWAFPVLKEDFRGDEDCAAFHFRLGKGGQIAIMDWNRDRISSL